MVNKINNLEQAKEDKEERKEQRRGEKGAKREGKKLFVTEWDKGLLLDREETDMAHRQMTIYKETMC